MVSYSLPIKVGDSVKIQETKIEGFKSKETIATYINLVAQDNIINEHYYPFVETVIFTFAKWMRTLPVEKFRKIYTEQYLYDYFCNSILGGKGLEKITFEDFKRLYFSPLESLFTLSPIKEFDGRRFFNIRKAFERYL